MSGPCIRARVIGASRHSCASRVGEAMLRAAVHDELKVSPSVVHLLDKGVYVAHRDMRIESAVAHQYLCLQGLRPQWFRGLQATVNADDRRNIGTASRKFQY